MNLVFYVYIFSRPWFFMYSQKQIFILFFFSWPHQSFLSHLCSLSRIFYREERKLLFAGLCSGSVSRLSGFSLREEMALLASSSPAFDSGLQWLRKHCFRRLYSGLVPALWSSLSLPWFNRLLICSLIFPPLDQSRYIFKLSLIIKDVRCFIRVNWRIVDRL